MLILVYTIAVWWLRIECLCMVYVAILYAARFDRIEQRLQRTSKNKVTVHTNLIKVLLSGSYLVICTSRTKGLNH